MGHDSIEKVLQTLNLTPREIDKIDFMLDFGIAELTVSLSYN